MATKLVSVVTGGSNSHQTSSAEINGIATDFISQGVVGAISATSGVAPTTGAFAVNQIGTPTMDVRVTNGVAYVTATPTGGSEQTFRVTMYDTEDVTIAANATGGTRYDWVYIKLDADKLVNPAVDASDVATLTTSRSTSASTDNGTPPTYGYAIAVVTVANGASSITNANITDSRQQTGPNNVLANTLRSNSNSHLALVPGTSKLVKTTVLRQDDTTNAYQSGNTVTLTGWGVITATAAAGFSEAVTFGVTFANKPIVMATSGGDAASSSTYGDGGANVKLFVTAAYSITTTGFTVNCTSRDGTSWSSGNKIFYQWMAIGELA